MEIDINERIANLEKRVAALEERSISVSVSARTKKTSIREFLDMAEPKTQTDLVVFIAYFKENYEELTSFTVKDLLQGFADAKEKNPTNINALVNSNISRGLLMTSREKEGNLKRFEMTNKGIKFVGENLSKRGE